MSSPVSNVFKKRRLQIELNVNICKSMHIVFKRVHFFIEMQQLCDRALSTEELNSSNYLS